MAYVRRIMVTAGLLAGEAMCIGALAIAGRAPFMSLDLRSAEPVDAFMSVLRVASLVAMVWLTVSTLVYLAAGRHRADIPRWFTLPLIRRLVDGTIAAVVASGAIASPAYAVPPPVIVTVDSSGVILPPGIEVREQLISPTGRGPVPVPGTGAPTPAVVTVRSGDNLWTISRRHLNDLGEDLDRLPAYWARVVEVNRGLLRSGNPDLIYPGETVLLPPI